MANEDNIIQDNWDSIKDGPSNSKTSKKREWSVWKNRRRDRLDSIGWAITFIWGALVLLAHLTGFGDDIDWWSGWGVFFTGIAAVVLLGTFIRLLVPEYRRPGLIWGFIFGLILLGIGLGEITLWIWAILLGLIGISILYRVLLSNNQEK